MRYFLALLLSLCVGSAALAGGSSGPSIGGSGSFTFGTTTFFGGTAPCFAVNSTGNVSVCDAITAGNIAALAIATGNAGAPVLFNGAGGTPTAINLSNGTVLPIAGLTGLGTNVATALAQPIGGTSGLVIGGANSNITSLTGLTTPLSVPQGGTGAATLASSGLVVAHGTSAFTALAEVDGDCVVGAAGAWTAASCPGGGSSLTVGSVTSVTTITPGNGLVVTGTTGTATINTTYPVETTQTASFSVAAGEMGKLTPVNISGGGTITLPLSGAFTTVFGAGQTWCAVNTGATADTVTNSTGGTMVPSITSVASGASLCLQSDGAALYAIYTLAAYSGSGTVTTSGSPASGDIAQFSSSTAITTATATGTGSVVRATSPTLVTPALGTPASGNGANLTNIQNAAVTAAPLPTPGSGATLVAPRSYYICTTTCTVTPPVPAAGYEFCVQNDVGVSTVITMAAIGSSARYGKTDQSAYGTAGTGTFVSGGAAGDKICLLGRDSTHYVTASFNGVWTAN